MRLEKRTRSERDPDLLSYICEKLRRCSVLQLNGKVKTWAIYLRIMCLLFVSQAHSCVKWPLGCLFICLLLLKQDHNRYVEICTHLCSVCKSQPRCQVRLWVATVRGIMKTDSQVHRISITLRSLTVPDKCPHSHYVPTWWQESDNEWKKGRSPWSPALYFPLFFSVEGLRNGPQ